MDMEMLPVCIDLLTTAALKSSGLKRHVMGMKSIAIACLQSKSDWESPYMNSAGRGTTPLAFFSEDKPKMAQKAWLSAVHFSC